MAAYVAERLSQLLVRLAFVFEPVSPRFISFFLGRWLRDWKKKGLIDSYKTETKRIGKFHFRINVNLGLTPQQTANLLSHLVEKLKRIKEVI